MIDNKMNPGAAREHQLLWLERDHTVGDEATGESVARGYLCDCPLAGANRYLLVDIYGLWVGKG